MHAWFRPKLVAHLAYHLAGEPDVICALGVLVCNLDAITHNAERSENINGLSTTPSMAKRRRCKLDATTYAQTVPASGQ